MFAWIVTIDQLPQSNDVVPLSVIHPYRGADDVEILLRLFAQVIAQLHLPVHHRQGQVVPQEGAQAILEQDQAPPGPGFELDAVSINSLCCLPAKCSIKMLE